MPLLTIKTLFRRLFLMFLSIYLFLAVLGPLLQRLFSSVASGGYPLVVVHELLTVVASLAVEHGL